jgi:aspartate racemase
MTRHVGIVGHSAEGAALCLRTVCGSGSGYEHPDVTLDIISMARAMPLWDKGDHAAVREIFATNVTRLAAAGAEFFVCPDNTAHLALEAPGPPLALPGLHIAAVVAEQASRERRTRVGILGTRFTMGGPIYPRVLGGYGIAAQLPDPADRELVDRVIFDELVYGVLTEESRQAYLAVIGRLADRGCDAVALVCTEIPLLVTPDVSPLSTLDSTRLLARAAYDVAVGNRPLPTWRGGPYPAGG